MAPDTPTIIRRRPRPTRPAATLHGGGHGQVPGGSFRRPTSAIIVSIAERYSGTVGFPDRRSTSVVCRTNCELKQEGHRFHAGDLLVMCEKRKNRRRHSPTVRYRFYYSCCGFCGRGFMCPYAGYSDTLHKKISCCATHLSFPSIYLPESTSPQPPIPCYSLLQDQPPFF